jgi:capsular exopolysaccharide synthesis family protein
LDLRDSLHTLRKNWLLVVLCTLIALGAALAVTLGTPSKYQASSQLFVAARDSSGDVNGLNAGGQFTQQRVQSYADIVDSPEVASAVAARLGGISANQISREVSANAPLNTVLINVHVTDKSPARAQAVANAISDEFASYVTQLETPSGSSVSPVKVTVVKRADLPTSPISPKKKLNLALGLILGLALGAAGAVLRDTLDTSVRDPERAQAETGAALLGAIAYDSDAHKRPLIVHADPHSPRAEAFRSLRTNLQFVNVDQPPRSIVVTSSIPEEGKTTTAANLAISLAQSGARVLLVEADLRRPRVADYFGIEGAVGLTNLLIGRVALSDAIQTWGRDENLWILPSGPTPPNPSELLGSRGMANLVHELESQFDLVILDAPPLLPVTDAAVLSTLASGAVVIVRHGQTKREQLHRAVESLRSVDVTVYGLILTMTPSKGAEARYYGYGYQYDHHTARTRGKADLVTPEPAQRPQSDAAMPSPAGSAPSPVGSNGHGGYAPYSNPTAPPAVPAVAEEQV